MLNVWMPYHSRVSEGRQSCAQVTSLSGLYDCSSPSIKPSNHQSKQRFRFYRGSVSVSVSGSRELLHTPCLCVCACVARMNCQTCVFNPNGGNFFFSFANKINYRDVPVRFRVLGCAGAAWL